MAARRAKGKDSKPNTVIAIDKDKNSQHALKWAVENIVVDSPNCILLHVQTKLSKHLYHHHNLYHQSINQSNEKC